MRPAIVISLAAACVLAGLGAAGASAKHDLLPQPQLRPIHASFKPSPEGEACAPPYCTTTYKEKAKGDALTYTWRVRIPADRACAKGFKANSPTPNRATWYHADTSEGGYCNHTYYNASSSGHPGTVTVTVTNADWRCKATFTGTQGPQAQPVWNGPPPKKCRRRH